MEYQYQQLEEKFKLLPEDIRRVISSAEIMGKIADIAENHDLMLDKADELAQETSFVMLGLTHPNEFIPHLRKRLGVSDDVVNKIADEVNEQVFKEIRESLKKIHDNPSSLESHQEVTPQSREEILSDIENPVPSSEHTREESVPAPVPPALEKKLVPKAWKDTAGPRMEKLIPESATAPEALENIPEPAVAPTALSIADAKLNSPVGAPRVVEIRKIQNKEAGREYKEDPYRETI